MNMKPLLKSLSGLFEHSDKNVRAEVCRDLCSYVVPVTVILVCINSEFLSNFVVIIYTTHILCLHNTYVMNING